MSAINIYLQLNQTVTVQPCSSSKDLNNTVIIKNKDGNELFKIQFNSDGSLFKFDAKDTYMRVPDKK